MINLNKKFLIVVAFMFVLVGLISFILFLSAGADKLTNNIILKNENTGEGVAIYNASDFAKSIGNIGNIENV